eukprot:TRINITY_DN2250_c0_g1_i1.p1 TRINITY_DN2250_c0_g1~~TRINITY_DN2250_c0_g1_i1.p1  ORF type:complete len:705 (-),score=132.60 TRINITY_DN2250_c0_g1_i1:110-2224(-)
MSVIDTIKQNIIQEFKAGNFNIPIAGCALGFGGLLFIDNFIKQRSEDDITPTPQTPPTQTQGQRKSSDTTQGQRKLETWNDFIRRLRRLLPILIPKLFSSEVAYIVLLAGMLTARTALSSIIADVSGKAAGYLVSKRADLAVKNLAGYIVLSIPAAYVNGLLKYLTTRLALRMRMNLNKYIHERYLNGVTFYNICNLGSYKIDNVAERITLDIKSFCDKISDIYTSTFKPTMDIVFFTYKLAQATTWRGPFILYSYFLFSSLCKMLFTPPFGKLGAKESQLQGDFRSAHERLITNSEEVAFYDGSIQERTIINRKLNQLHDHIIVNATSKLFIAVIDNIIVKYWATLAGYAAIFTPILVGAFEKKDVTELTEYYSKNMRYLTNLADAIGNFVLLGNKLSELRGHTKRVGEIVEKLDQFETMELGQFTRKTKSENDHIVVHNEKFLNAWKDRCDKRPQEPYRTEQHVVGNVNILEGEEIQFEHIDIVSPDGKLLAEDLNFVVQRNQNVMVTGPNGCGKSSLFRIIGELWPPHANKDHQGLIVKPRKKDIVFIPQKPYLVLGTLRDQIIYPHSKQEMESLGVTDHDLRELLRIVDPKENILKNWDWDEEKDWFLAFSGGQKQRVAMARLFYHRPRYAILDECTSAVSDEVEDEIYRTASHLGITLFTVSHRKYLRKHHDFILTIEGRDGKWAWKQITDKERYDVTK